MTGTRSRGTLSGSTNGTLTNSGGNCLGTKFACFLLYIIIPITMSILALRPYSFEQDAGVYHGTIMQGLAADNVRSCSGFYIGCKVQGFTKNTRYPQ